MNKLTASIGSLFAATLVVAAADISVPDSGSAHCLSRIVRAVSMLERRIPYLTKTAEESAMRFLRNPYAIFTEILPFGTVM